VCLLQLTFEGAVEDGNWLRITIDTIRHFIGEIMAI
jgi:hypothetical protein